MTPDEINQLTEKIFLRVKNIPGLDREFVRKCLVGITLLHDPQVEDKIRTLARFL